MGLLKSIYKNPINISNGDITESNKEHQTMVLLGFDPDGTSQPSVWKQKCFSSETGNESDCYDRYVISKNTGINSLLATTQGDAPRKLDDGNTVSVANTLLMINGETVRGNHTDDDQKVSDDAINDKMVANGVSGFRKTNFGNGWLACSNDTCLTTNGADLGKNIFDGDTLVDTPREIKEELLSRTRTDLFNVATS